MFFRKKRMGMKKAYLILFMAGMMLSGCGQEGGNEEKENIGQVSEQATEQMAEIEIEKEAEDETEKTLEGEAENEDSINEKQPWEFTVKDPGAYDLSWEELKSLRQERDVKIEEQETELPQELVEVLQDILIRQLSERSNMGEFSAEDYLEPYRAKDCEVDAEGVKNFLGNSTAYDCYMEKLYAEELQEAYITDLDGDGKKEAVVLSYTSGTVGYSYLYIWQQKEDGTNEFFEERYTYWYDNTGLLFIGGHYYYVAELIGRECGEYEGFLVFSFLEDGTVKLDEVVMESQHEGKIWTKLYENEMLESTDLDSIRSYIENRKSEIENDEVWKGEVEIYYEGSGYDFNLESFHLWGDAPYSTLVDFDNDGEVECCYKKMTESSHDGVFLVEAILKKQGSYARQLEFDFPKYEFPEHTDCRSWTLWFEQFNGQNYIFYETRIVRSSDYFLTVQLVRDGELYPVMNYLLLDKKVCKCETIAPEIYLNFK